MSRVSTYSDIDVSSSWLNLNAKYDMARNWWLQMNYSYASFTDKDPYIYSKEGHAHFYSLLLGRSF